LLKALVSDACSAAIAGGIGGGLGTVVATRGIVVVVAGTGVPADASELGWG
jgi:hypothetical protein